MAHNIHTDDIYAVKAARITSLSITHRLYHPEYLFIRDGSADPDVDVIIRYRQNSRLIARIVELRDSSDKGYGSNSAVLTGTISGSKASTTFSLS